MKKNNYSRSQLSFNLCYKFDKLSRFAALFSFFIFHSSFQCAAQPRMRDCILSMPDSMMTLLTKVNRADCIDFREANMEAKVSNRLGGTTELSVLTDDYALWQYTSASQMEMKLLPMTDSTSVICVVHTVQTPVSDSRIAFYDTAWTPLPTPNHYLPSSNHYLPFTTRYSLFPDSLTLQAELRSENYEMKDESAELTPTNTVIRYDWTEGRFVIRQ